jgi:ACS family tartrate transporter-like MFS transporter
MISWGILAALTAFVRVPWHFYTVRFLLGLAEAGFFPAIVVYLTHWFPSRDRARALAYFFVAIPTAQMLTPGMSSWLLEIGAEGNPRMLGLAGWQWVYIVWGLPAVLLGLIVLFWLTDRPGQARWLDADERAALEEQLKREKALRQASRHITVLEALRNRKVLILAGAYFCTLTFTYGLTAFVPSILERWYKLKLADLTWLLILPSFIAFFGYLFIGWNSDRTQERRLHTVVPIYLGAAAMALAALLDTPPLRIMVGLLILGTITSTFLPAFWALPNLFLTESAAAGSIGFINSLGNLGGLFGPALLGAVSLHTGDFRIGLVILACLAIFSGTVILNLGLGKRPAAGSEPAAPDVLDEMLTGPI